MRKLPILYVVTRHRLIAKAKIERVSRGGHEYFYLQWRDGAKTVRRYLGAQA